ncbi:hypothetical protein, partial [Stenotrophomonas sepilia]|uniref:hypothetical protein n=1 Tax=Stenotrophomonas sepilia TaxID=2860290 RepID=UPI00265B4B77
MTDRLRSALPDLPRATCRMRLSRAGTDGEVAWASSIQLADVVLNIEIRHHLIINGGIPMVIATSVDRPAFRRHPVAIIDGN